jgi:hypothetical protein
MQPMFGGLKRQELGRPLSDRFYFQRDKKESS